MSKKKDLGRTIKKIAPIVLVSTLVFVFGSQIAQAQDKVVTSTGSLIEVHYGFDRPIITTVGGYVSVTMEGLSKIQKAGRPKLPVMPVTILIPFGRRAKKLDVIPGSKIELEGRYIVEPGQRPVPLSFTGPVEPTPPDPQIYSASKSFPGVLNSRVHTQGKRGFRILVLSLFPVEYIPGEGNLSYYETMTVRVETEPAPVPPGRRGFHERDKTYMRRIVDNPETVDTYPKGIRGESSSLGRGLLDPTQDYHYVVITNQALSDSALTLLVANKQARGISATIITTEWIYENYDGARPDGGVDNQTKIRNFIIDAYQNWGTQYVLLAGYKEIIPPRLLWVESGPGGYVDEMPADLYYGCLDGTFDEDADGRYGEPNDGPGGGEVDLYYEVYVGRAAVENATEVSHFVAKTLAYEGSSDAYLHLAGMVGEHLGFGGDSEYAKNSMEEIRLGSGEHGYTTVGFEDSPYAGFFMTHHTEISDCPGRPPPLYDADGTWPESQLIDFINNGHCGYPGVQIVNHLGHANYTYCMKLYNSDLSSLTNDRYFFAYSQGCMPGGFDTDDCFAEEITAMEHGAFAVIMNARYGWGTRNSTDGPSQRYHRPFWHAVFGQGLLQLARANAFSKEHFNVARIDDDCMRWCYYETNLFGDPELRLKTGAGVGYQSHTIDDDAEDESSGDGDGLVEPGETIEMPVTLGNLSDDTVHNITAVLSTADPYTNITDNTETFGDIPAGGSGTCADDFGFYVDPSCPEDHFISFQLDITGDEGSWTGSFAVEVHKDPDITVTPQELDATVSPGGRITRALTIGNVGIGDLTFRITARPTPQSGDLGATGSGGPDSYGYVWIDSDESGGPPYAWVEISDTGTEITLGDDDSEEIALPFTFPFYGADKTSVKISSNGYLTFGRDGTDSGNDQIPDSNDPNDFIAPFWDDLNPFYGFLGRIYYYYDEPISRFIVEYKEVEHWWSGNPETFEVILHADGTIVYHYQVVSNATSCTVGIENADGSDGLGVTYNAGYLHDALAVKISSGIAWLSFEPASGTVAPGDALDVSVTFDAAGLTGGTYEADILVGSNDPDDPQVTIPATLHVGAGGDGWFEVFDYDAGTVVHKDWGRVHWAAYRAANGEIHPACGDIDGDGRDEIVLGLGPVSGDSAIPGGWFQVLDDDYSHLAWGRINWGTYNSANGESWPGCGDIDGDGRDEIIVGLGPYPADGGWFEVFDYGAGSVVHRDWGRVHWAAYRTANGEIRPACGDIDGDGRDEIILGLGPVSGDSAIPGGSFQVLDDDYSHLVWGRINRKAYNSANGESWPGCGDVDGDGADEIIIGLGSGGDGSFEVFDYDAGSVVHKDWGKVDWGAYRTANGEIRPACGDVDGDGRDEIVLGLGPVSGDSAIPGGWFQVLDDDHSHLAWGRINWGAYNSANGESWPCSGDVDGDGADEIIIGL